jgi:hypothetical protein
MRKTIITMAATVSMLGINATASELVHEFKSPAFSGIGYSSHVLTIEQLETNRRQKNREDARAELDRAEREYKNTNAYKFQNNLESRIYAQLSRQIADQLFGESSGSQDANGIAETPFGDTITWSRVDNNITVIVRDSNGDELANFSVPVGSFAF